MHELFLTAHISDDDRPGALRILQGYCAMSPVPILRRRLYWKGPLTRNRGIDSAFIMAQGQKVPLWRTLNEQLTRQAYIVTLLYDITRDQFPKPDAPDEEKPIMDCDAIHGTLQWTDLPDPAGARPVNSRLSVTIEGEKGLCNLLESSSYRFHGEIVEEGYRFVHGNVVIYLTRYLDIPAKFQEMEYEGKPKVNRSMPPYESLQPFDSENKWIITASSQVLSANDLEYMKKGTDELMEVKTDFEGFFDFQSRDRHIFDTRVKT